MFNVDGMCVLKSASILQYISGIGSTGIDANVVKRRQLQCKNCMFISDSIKKSEKGISF
jgi:uncharacterized protein (DUF2235 family)